MNIAHRWSRRAALATFALAPLPFGSVDRAWILFWLLILSVSLATADFSGIRRGQFQLILIGTFVLAVYAAVAWIQASGWTGPFAAPIWQEAGRLLGESLRPRISSIGTSVLLTLAPALLFAMAAFRAFVLATEPGGADQIARVIGAAAVAYALYSAVSLIAAPNMLLWREKEAYLSSLTGTFTNRNTAATYFGGAAVIWLLTLVHELRIRSSRKMDLRHSLQAHLRQPPGAVLLAAGGFLVCFSAVAATGSRAGFLLTSACLLLAVTLSVDSWKLLGRLGWMRLGAGAAAALVLFEIWGGGVAARIDQRGLADMGRLSVYVRSLDILAEYPVFGIGLGAFESVFPSRRPAALGSAGIWDRAHSTPLEMAIEMGLPVTLLVAALFVAALAALARASFRSRRRGVIAGLCFGLLGVLHSCVDFSLQIPGYAVTFAALTAAGLASLDRVARNSRDRVRAAAYPGEAGPTRD